MNPTTKPIVPVKKQVNAGLIVLQWLTYAFWGWTVLALSALTAAVVTNFIDPNASGNFTTYGIAAVLVLLPISFICDAFYSKKEPTPKEGAATWVMVIHAVIFALFGIGALICAVFAVVALLTSSSVSKVWQITILSSLIIAGFYAVTFLRTLNPGITPWIQKSYKFIMLALVGIIIVLGIIGPVARERATRDDRLVVAQLSSLANEISSYARSNDKLPARLGDVDLRNDTKQIVDRNLVQYKPGAAAPATALADGATTRTVYRYQLCVDYKQASHNNYGEGYNTKDADGYADYIDASDHDAGPVCYKMKTSEY